MFAKPAFDIIKERYSCRSFDGKPVHPDTLTALQAFIDKLPAGPFGSSHRFVILAAQEGDASALKGLATYGFIQNFSAFVVGILGPGEHNLEDFGYQTELIDLKITELGLGSCWLGGTFNRGRFAKTAKLKKGESMPAVLALGNIPSDKDTRNGTLRIKVGGNARKPSHELFFDTNFSKPLSEIKEPWASVLEAVRQGPSASNKQPWRLVRQETAGTVIWHLFLQRTPGYGKGIATKLLDVPDIQRLDSGIAMSHFTLLTQAQKLSGSWKSADPGLVLPDLTEYVASWT